MYIQYLNNGQGEATAVVIPIDSWKILKSNHPELETELFYCSHEIQIWVQYLAIKELPEVCKRRMKKKWGIDVVE